MDVRELVENLIRLCKIQAEQGTDRDLEIQISALSQVIAKCAIPEMN